MAFIFRTMLRDGDKPQVGASAQMLGVRVPPNPHADITVGDSGDVLPRTGGMSIAPNWRDLPLHRIPQRLSRIVPDAHGSDRLACWRMAEKPFVDGPLTDQLALRINGAKHGLIEPSTPMQLDAYRLALAATRDSWIVDEE